MANEWLIGAVIVILLFGFVVFFGAPYVPSKRRELKRAFTQLYPLGTDDTLVDLGAGDGIVLRMAARRGARAIGYELNPILVLLAKLLSRHDDEVSVRLGNMWKVQLPKETTVVYVFGDGRDIKKLFMRVSKEATRLGKPIKIISYGFDLPGITPEKTVGAHHLYTLKPLQSRKGTV